MMFKNSTNHTFLCVGLMAALVVGCGKKTDTETVYVQTPPEAPKKATTETINAPVPAAPAAETQVPLKIEVGNRDQIEGQTLPLGNVQVHFGLAATDTQIPPEQVTYYCKIENEKSVNTSVGEKCVSPKTFQVRANGQTTITISGILQNGSEIFDTSVISFNAGRAPGVGGNGGGGQNGGGVFGNGGFDGNVNCGGAPCQGQGGAIVRQQLGDLFSVNIPQGFHMVHRSSTFDNPGYLDFKMIDGGKARDTAFPFYYDCGKQGSQFEGIEQLVMPGGTLGYCNITPPLSWNSPANPVTNPFRWMTNSMMSYNSIGIASDESLVGFSGVAPGQQTMAKLYANVFSNLNCASCNAFQAQFASELNATVSRLNVACGGNKPQFLGNAALFQGFFTGSAAVGPLFGCTVQRNGQYFVEVGAYPIEQVMPYMPTQRNGFWDRWINNNFANRRSAEIVVELGPYPVAPIPMMVAQSAQALMVQNIKKITP